MFTPVEVIEQAEMAGLTVEVDGDDATLRDPGHPHSHLRLIGGPDPHVEWHLGGRKAGSGTLAFALRLIEAGQV